MQPTGAAGQSIPKIPMLCHCAAADALFALIPFCTKKKGIVLIVVVLLDRAID